MAAYTTTQAGDWSATATWGGTGPPDSGDTAEIAHDVVVASDATIGEGPTNLTDCSLWLNGGKLTVASDTSFRIKGNVVHQNSLTEHVDDFVVKDGATVEVSSFGVAGTPAYRWVTGTGTYQRSLISIVGTESNRVTFRSHPSGGPFNFTNNVGSNYNAGRIVAQYCDFTRIGSSTTAFTSLRMNSSYAKLSLHSCVFDTCGGIDSTGLSNVAAGFQLHHNVWKNSYPVPGTARVIEVDGWGSVTSSRVMRGNVFDIQAFINSATSWTIVGNIFNQNDDSTTPLLIGSTSGAADEFKDNLMRSQYEANINMVCLKHSEDNHYICDNDVPNPHLINMDPTAGTGSRQTIDGWIFESASSSNVGESCAWACQPFEKKTFAAINCLQLPGYYNSSRTYAPRFMGITGNSNASYYFDHNTVFGAEGNEGNAAFGIGETYASQQSSVAGFKNNLIWGNSDYSVHKFGMMGAGIASNISDTLMGVNTDYNASWNLRPGADGSFYSCRQNGTGGVDFAVNDFVAEPQFVDSTRCAVEYAQNVLGASWSVRSIVSMAQERHSVYTAATRPKAVADWIKAGFAPTNPVYDASSSDGSTVGAVPYTSGVAILTKQPNSFIYSGGVPIHRASSW